MSHEVEGSVLDRMVRIGLSEKLALEPRSDGSEGMRHADIRKESFPGRGNAKYKGPEACPNLELESRQEGQGHQNKMS